MLRFGFHVSASGGITKIPERVESLGGECFQFFARSPHGGKAKELEEAEVKEFKEGLKKLGLKNYYIHTPYFINLASKDNRIFFGSINAIKEDLKRAKILGAKYVVTHLGSARDFKIETPLFEQNYSESFSKKYFKELLVLAQKRKFDPSAFLRVVAGLEKIAGQEKNIPLLIEISAGSGAVLGATFEEISYYLEAVPALSGFCLDTAHAFASGYDFRTTEEIKSNLIKMEKWIGRDKLKLIHFNDSLAEFDSKVDRHAHLGQGKIGEKAFLNLVDYFYKEDYNTDVILETPTPEGMARDLSLLKNWRSNLV